MENRAHHVECQICKQQKRFSQVVPGELVRPPIVEMIIKEHPDWSSQGFICFSDLNHFYGAYVEDLLAADRGEVSVLESRVIASLKNEEELLSTNLNLEFDRQLTLGERVADKVAEFGGSWLFIGTFAVVLVLWIAFNSMNFLWQPFDPYPYILLNLVLSCLAALQAPVIMMSQNRQEAKDRLRAEHDYRVNLKAEIEIRQVIAKLDQLVTHQWQRLLEIQRLQLELIQEHPRTPSEGKQT
jgi:uncharacterized membrane protein